MSSSNDEIAAPRNKMLSQYLVKYVSYLNFIYSLLSFPHCILLQQILGGDEDDPEVQFLKSLSSKQKKKLLK